MMGLLNEVAKEPVENLAGCRAKPERILAAVPDPWMAERAALERTMVDRHDLRPASGRAVTPAAGCRAEVGHRLARPRFNAKHAVGFLDLQV